MEGQITIDTLRSLSTDVWMPDAQLAILIMQPLLEGSVLHVWLVMKF